MPTDRDSVERDLEAWNDWVVAEPFGHPISINKIHAFQYGGYLGCSVGLIANELWTLATFFIFVTVTGSFGVYQPMIDRATPPVEDESNRAPTTIAIQSIYHKPHYFLFTFFVVFSVVVEVFA